MEGTCYPHAISGTGEVVYSSVFLNGTCMNISTTGEAVKYCWDYYDFTRDTDFLREIGYPILKERPPSFSATICRQIPRPDRSISSRPARRSSPAPRPETTNT